MKFLVTKLVALFAALVLIVFGFVTTAHAATTNVDAANQNLQFNNTVKIGQNAPVGFSTRYANVFTGVDAIVSVTAITNTTISNVDRVSTVNNWQLWNNEQIGAGGGSATYRVEFVAAGTRDPVIMQNFSANVGDIDARQYVQFTGPSSYTLSNNSQLAVTSTAGAYKFAEMNGVGSTDDDTRFWAQVKYDAVSSIDFTLGAGVGGSALFQVSFGSASWGGTEAPAVTPPVVQYTVSYALNSGGATGGGGATASSTANSGTAHTVAASTFTPPTNYTFVAWNTQADGSGVSYSNPDTIRPTTDVTLYAIWQNLQTTVTYDGNQNTGGNVPVTATVNAGAQYQVSGNSAQVPLYRDGYSFVGWNTLANGNGVFYEPGTLTSIVANTVFYAVWQPLPVVPPDAPINIDVEPGDPIGGGEVDYVIPDQPYDPNCNPTTNPGTAWTIMVTPLNPTGTPYEIDAGCTPSNGDIYGTAVLPQDVPEGIYEVVYESTDGEKIIRYFEVGPGGTFIGQTNTDPRLADTGSNAAPFVGLAAVLMAGGAVVLALAHRRRISA